MNYKVPTLPTLPFCSATFMVCYFNFPFCIPFLVSFVCFAISSCCGNFNFLETYFVNPSLKVLKLFERWFFTFMVDFIIFKIHFWVGFLFSVWIFCLPFWECNHVIPMQMCFLCLVFFKGWEEIIFLQGRGRRSKPLSAADLSWLNLSYETFKIKCKKLFITN